MEQQEYIIMHEVEQTHWWFASKRFLIRSVLERVMPSAGSQNAILDMGCGTGINEHFLKEFGKTFGLDLSMDALRLSKERGIHRLTGCDINVAIPFKDNQFDAVVCLDVLEHMDDDRPAIEEMFRVCKPGGCAIITVPAFNIQWSAHDVAVHHKRRYTRKLLLQKISGLHWKVLKSSYYNMALFLPILTVRKLKALFTRGQLIPKSDVFMPMPNALNRLLAQVMKTEIKCLNFANFPFGVSLLLVLQKEYD